MRKINMYIVATTAILKDESYGWDAFIIFSDNQQTAIQDAIKIYRQKCPESMGWSDHTARADEVTDEYAAFIAQTITAMLKLKDDEDPNELIM